MSVDILPFQEINHAFTPEVSSFIQSFLFFYIKKDDTA